MLSDDNPPGVNPYLTGLIILVMAGVGLAWVVERRFLLSSSVCALERETLADSKDLEQLRLSHQVSARRLAASNSKTLLLAEQHVSLLRQLRDLEQRRSSLVAAREQLQGAIQSLAQEFAQYRASSRAKIWTEAVGQPLANLIGRGGREYRQAVIVRVTDVGLEIRHEEGTARIQAPDLDPALQERFQWTDDERHARLKQELLATQDRVADSPDPASVAATRPERPLPFQRETARPDSRKLESLRDQVKAWKSKVTQLTSDHHAARAQAGSRTQSSIPGSLETWQARATRLETALANAKAELAAAQAVLAAYDPNQPPPEPPESPR